MDPNRRVHEDNQQKHILGNDNRILRTWIKELRVRAGCRPHTFSGKR